jgi:polysaccharide biosynthesis protein PslH
MNPSLRILQITNRIPYPLNDGGNIATYNVTHFLNEAGHQVTLASLNTKKHYQDPSVLKNITTRVYDVTIDTTITFFGLLAGVFEAMPYNIKRFKSNDFKALLINIFSKNTYDIVQIEGSYMALYIPTIRQYSKAKIVLRSHNIEHEIWQRMSLNETNPLKKYYFSMLSKKIKKFEDISLHGFDAIVAITSRDADYYKNKNYKGELIYINAGADLELFVPDNTKLVAGSICFLAGLDWLPNKQGLDWFLSEIWNAVSAKYPHISLHIAGKAMPESYYLLQSTQIKVHGMVPDAMDYLQNYEIFIVPLLSGGGMRLKVVEGMALAKCIVTTQVGAEGVDYTINKDIIIADTPEQWIEQLSYLIENPSEINRIGNNAHRLAQKKYNWKNLVDSFISLYYRVLN